MEAIKVSINGRKDKQMFYSYVVEYYSVLKKEGNSDICFNMKKIYRPAKWNKLVTEKTNLHVSTLIWGLKVAKIKGIESRMMVASGWQEEGMGSYYLIDREF